MPITYDALLREARRSTNIEALVREHILEGMPFVFEEEPAHYDILRVHLSNALDVPAEAITIVGSSRLGYSLNPSHPGMPMSESSDVDVIVANEALFDSMWGMLLSWRYPWHMKHWPEAEREWGTRHLENFIAGHSDPHRIRFAKLGFPRYRRQLLKFSNRWFAAFKTTSRYPELASRDFKGRLYRSWGFATKYHAYGLRVLCQMTPPPPSAAA